MVESTTLRGLYGKLSDVENILRAAAVNWFLMVCHIYVFPRRTVKRERNSSVFRESVAIHSRSVVFTTPVDVHCVHSAVNVR